MVCKPGSVNGNHSSGVIITDQLKQPTLRQPDKDARLYKINLSVAVCHTFGLAFNRACRATKPLSPCGGLLPHLFTLTRAVHRRFVFCDAFHRVAPPGRYPVLCPCEARTFLHPKGQRSPNHLTRVIIADF